MGHSNCSLGISKKIKKSETISKILKTGRRKSSDPLRIHYLWESNDYHTVRSKFVVGFIVPKRVYRLAVRRNKIKRWLREAVRQQQHLISAKDNQHLQLLIVATRVEIKTYQEVEDAVIYLLSYLSSK